MLCVVVKHAKASRYRALRSVVGNTRRSRMFLPTFCSSRFLSALQSSSSNSPRITSIFKTKSEFSKRTKVLYSCGDPQHSLVVAWQSSSGLFSSFWVFGLHLGLRGRFRNSPWVNTCLWTKNYYSSVDVVHKLRRLTIFGVRPFWTLDSHETCLYKPIWLVE